MKSNYNSFTAKLYRWFYIKEEMPNNLCPYFWKCVLMYIFIIPVGIIAVPSKLFELVIKQKSKSLGDRVSMGIMACISLGILMSTLLVITTGLFLTTEFFNKYKLFYIPGLCLLGVACFVGVIAGACQLTKRLRRKDKKERTPSIVKEFVKAKYSRYCPKIDWIK